MASEAKDVIKFSLDSAWQHLVIEAEEELKFPQPSNGKSTQEQHPAGNGIIVSDQAAASEER